MGEEKISISDKKQVHVEFNQEFDDVDLLSDAEKEALEADIDEGDGPPPDDDADDKTAAEEAKQSASEDAKKAEADAKAEKEAEDAKKAKEAEEKEAEEAKEADETKDKDGKEDEPKDLVKPEKPQQPFPDIGPPLTMRGLSEEELKSVQDGLAEAKKKFQEGEIDYDEYLDTRDNLNKRLWQHEFAADMTAESVGNRWEWEQETFLNAAENEWINNDDVVYAAFASTVNMILSTEEGQVMPGGQLLTTAREEVAKRFSPSQPQERAKEEEQTKKRKAMEGAKKKEAQKQPPETLGGKPAAEIDEGVGEFEWLDKLDGEEYEKAVVGLTEQQLKRYEASL